MVPFRLGTTNLRMTLDRLGLVEFLDGLFFLLRQNLASGRNGLVQPRNRTEANDGARNPFIDPRQSNMGYLCTS